MVNAVVLAGGKEKIAHNKSKAFLEFNGKRCIDYVVEALDDAETIDKILIVGNTESLGGEVSGHYVKDEKRGFFQNAIAGYTYFEESIKNKEPLFYIFSDIPLITSTAIDGFLKKCDYSKESDLNLALIDIEQINRFFPGYKKGYPHTAFSDIGFRMGNCGLAYPKKIKDSEFEGKYHIFENAYNSRRFDQVGSMIRFIFNARRIFLYEVFKRSMFDFDFYKGILKKEFNINMSSREFSDVFYNKTGLRLNLIHSYYPELAVDVDTEKEKKYLDNYLT